MFLMGNEDGTVYVVCDREECMVEGGRYWLYIETPYQGDWGTVKAVWERHEATH